MKIPIVIILFFLFTLNSSAQVQPLVDITDKDYQDMLQGMADKVLYKFNNMPSVRFVIKEDPRFYKNGKLHALAFYTRDNSGKPIIYVNPDYHKESKTLDLVNTVVHELTHAWVDWKGLYTDVSEGHNEAFLKKAIQLNLDLLGTLAAYPIARETYERLIKDPQTTAQDDSSSENCNPVETIGCFGENRYQVRFFASVNNPEPVEIGFYTLKKLPQIGSIYKRSKNGIVISRWKINDIKGSIIIVIKEKF